MLNLLRYLLKGKKGDIAYSYIIMIVLGILGIIFILWIYRGSIGPLGEKVLAIGNQAAP
jgi:hypothetical protein